MLDIKISLTTHNCEKCHLPLQKGDKFVHFPEEEKNYCENCIQELLFTPGEKIFNTRIQMTSQPIYIVDENEGKLLLDSVAFERLKDGIYGIKRIGEFLVVNAAGSKNASPDKLMKNSDGYLFEKNNIRLLLFLSPQHFRDMASFLEHDAEYLFLRQSFVKQCKCRKVHWLYDSRRRIVGIGIVPEAAFTLSFTDDRFCVAGTISCEELNEQYERLALNRQVKNALGNLSPKTMLDYCEKRIHGQGILLRRAVYQIYRYMESVAQCRDFQAQNWILTAPSGSGKTEFYRTIRDLFALYQIPIPVVSIDLSQITETGYKGDNVVTIPRKILSENPEAKGIAICFLDEADKKCIPSYGSNGIDNNAAVQANLLTLIEGSELKIETDDEQKDFNSNHTMFVLMGAFQKLRQQKQEKERAMPIGFRSGYQRTDWKDDIDRVTDSFFEDLSLQDMIDFGMMEELAGRMVQVVNFHRLSDDAMLELIRHKTAKISEDMGITIEMTEPAEREFLNISFGSLGVRRPINIIKELVQNAVAEVFFEGDFDIYSDRVIIDSTDSAYIKRNVRISECRREKENKKIQAK